jgi:hypothetical protein
MSTALYIETFTTIDECVYYLTESLGLKWDYEKEKSLTSKMYYKHKDTLVLYDPHQIIADYDHELN